MDCCLKKIKFTSLSLRRIGSTASFETLRGLWLFLLTTFTDGLYSTSIFRISSNPLLAATWRAVSPKPKT